MTGYAKICYVTDCDRDKRWIG